MLTPRVDANHLKNSKATTKRFSDFKHNSSGSNNKRTPALKVHRSTLQEQSNSTALALLTVFYLLGLALLDNYVYNQSQFSNTEYMVFGVTSVAAAISVLLAQYALAYEDHWKLVPFLVTQVAFTTLLGMVYGQQIAQQLQFAKTDLQFAVRLTLLMLHETILTFMQFYSLVISFRSFNYLRAKKMYRENQARQITFDNIL
ncbi:hypothetical protein DdX_08851 [Ditylenchus destructor]|uniref:Uncharacterized protein n=1 Tax=Ditylenchus destructor TaxID=166010 RepID=A0AAD4N1S0_9BILA|nr:hypothetical protein DdX_08851 [Ditylenchus destructor]